MLDTAKACGVVTRGTRERNGDVVQLVRTLPCHGRGRGFESRRPRHSFEWFTKDPENRSGSNSISHLPIRCLDPSEETNLSASGSRLICFPRARPPRQNGIHELSLREAFAFCRCLEILVGYVQIAVTQVIADHQLVFAHLCQHGSHRVPKGVSPYAGDADPLEGWLNLLLQHRSQP